VFDATTYQREYNAKKRAAGLCVRCSEVNDRPGLTYCSVCRGKLRRSTRNSNLRNYGLTIDAFEALIEGQGNRCALCGREFDGSRGPATVDHDHDTGVIRGVLDRMCNQGLGLFGDNADGIAKAIEYLEKTRV
jgi:hypothetical protein